MNRRRYAAMALLLLLAGAFAQFGLEFVPYERMFVVWTLGMGLLVALQAGLLMNAYRVTDMLLVGALMVVCGLLTAGCSIAYLIQPWINTRGGSRCSAALNLPVGIVGGLVFLWLAWRIYTGGRDG